MVKDKVCIQWYKKETVLAHISACCNIDLTGIGHADVNMNY